MQDQPLPTDGPVFEYGAGQLDYLRGRDKRLGEIIDKLGIISRPVIPEIFAALVHSIIGQQISTKAHETVWLRTLSLLGEVTPGRVLAVRPEELQAVGISLRKVDYIRQAALRFEEGEFDVATLAQMTDGEVIERLSSLKGVGEWSAEMLMLFSLQRPDILSFGDKGILRGLRMIYHHRRIDRRLFEKYRRRFSPCGSVASLYIWAVAAGAIGGMRDYAPKSSTIVKPKKPGR